MSNVTREEMENRMIASDMATIYQGLADNDIEFLYAVLSGDGFNSYNRLTLLELTSPRVKTAWILN